MVSNPFLFLSRSLGLLAASAVIAGVAGAAVIVVDDDGGAGVQFTDLPPAIAAAVPGDVILVHPGQYSAFVLAKGVTILGLANGVQVATGARVIGLPAGEIAVLAELEVRDLRLFSCGGTVVLDSVETVLSYQSSQPHLLEVDGCADVRVRGSSFLGTAFSGSAGNTAASVGATRLELVESKLRGFRGLDTWCGFGGSGGDGLATSSGAWLHVVASDVEGGEGGQVSYTCGALCNQGAGDGGTGLVLAGASTLLLMGPGSNHVQGGFAGNGGDCPCDGQPGVGLRVVASTAIHSGIQLLGGGAYCGSNGAPLVVTGGGSASQAIPPDPYLGLQGTPGAGTIVRFAIYGAPGDQVVLHLGRKPVVVPLPGVMIEQLTTQDRSISLGTIGAAGNKTFQFKIPVLLKQGFTFHAQAAVLRNGVELRTNSTPVVLR